MHVYACIHIYFKLVYVYISCFVFVKSQSILQYLNVLCLLLIAYNNIPLIKNGTKYDYTLRTRAAVSAYYMGAYERIRLNML